MELKPSILKELSEEHGMTPQPVMSKFTDDGDKLILEDELQRIFLIGNVDVQATATGVIVAVRGHEPEDNRGKFMVKDICYRELPAQVDYPVLEEDRYIALMSGLNLGSPRDNLLSLQMMIDLLTGQLGDEGQQEMVSKVVRVIMAGNALSPETQDKNSLTKAKYLTKKTEAGTVEAVKLFDDFLVQLVACVDVDLMPGEHDPANFTLPQQPLHRCMFPQAMVYPTLSCVTNPYSCSVDGVKILGTSGQTVDDIYKFSSMEDPLEILEKTLVWGHLAPTAPDTLGCYPFHDRDPFILQECPHIYFAANQNSFQQKMFNGPNGQKVCLLTIPKFITTSTVVLLNLRTLQCESISFDCSFPDSQDSSPDVDK